MLPMFHLRNAIVWVTLLQLAACAMTNSSTNIGDVEVGMSQDQVLTIMGQPSMRESYGGTEFLIYTSATGSSIPIGIVSGKVTSIGRAAYDIVVRSTAQSGSTTSRSRTSN